MIVRWFCVLPAIALASALSLGQVSALAAPVTTVSQTAALEAALTAAEAGDPLRAIAIYRSILSADPLNLDARAGLAAVYYRTGQYDRAVYHWGLALQHDLPAQLRRRMVELRNAARLAERLDVSFSLGVAQNDNVNAATRADTIDILGLPFRLDDGSKAKKMYGVEGAGGLHYRKPLSGRTALRQSAVLSWRVFPDSAFNDYMLSSETAYDYLSPDFEFQAAALVRARWLDGAPYSYETGGTLSVSRPLTPFLDVTGTLYAGHRWHETQRALDRDIFSASVSTGWTASESLRLGAFGVWRREDARTAANSHTALTAGATATATLPLNIRLDGHVGLTQRTYDAPSAFDMRDRRDLEFSASARATFGNLAIRNFAPYAGVAYTHNASTNTIHSFDQTRLSLGLTKIY